MKMYKRSEIVSWLEEYANDQNNHFGCPIKNGVVQDCACDLGSADVLYDFILEKLSLAEFEDK